MQLSYHGIAIRHQKSDSGAHLAQVSAEFVLQILYPYRFCLRHVGYYSYR